MMPYEFYTQFATIAILHLFAVMSPGPDFALIIRQSILFGRKASIATSIGIGVGILFHIFYCIIGLGYIITKYESVFFIIKLSGAIYLIFLGYKSLTTKSEIQIQKKTGHFKSSIQTSFSTGLITNILNPKATLFFLSLYTFIINEESNVSIQIFYGLWMSIITGAWFCSLSILLTNEKLIKYINKFSFYAQNATGIMLIIIGIRLLIK